MITNAGEIRELRTLEDFQSVAVAGTGYLIVTDRSVPTRVHRVGCPAVTEKHFVTKVITNGARRGRYHHCTVLDAVRPRFPSARGCAVCRSELV